MAATSKLKADIDARMLEAWCELIGTELANDPLVIATLRVTYARGYIDALTDRGALLKRHGYKFPGRNTGKAARG